ncbi:YhcN/YlaJ family sporulation lipoprotein [Tepidibacillus infernus]|uniref:YhcN/YlaJ family sporulation lipoprotein n=1 Tax=Tepidibacillus TaxID=1494427 RepID=UPI000853D78E|nr:YhcN/YlaJ family sporulation lipoprotein [Tepidibacillus sp. HK-1]GBF12618.1 sporulation lipoprotein YhcN/YlaJ [Tepidibacillus sp. HK-1]
MRKLFLYLIISLLTISLGCQATNKPPANEASPPTKKIKQTQRVPQTIPEPKRNQSPEATAHRLASIAIRVPQVNDATAVVFGKYAIVGIDVDATLDRSRVGTIKYSVAEALKEDPQGANALVTSDPDIMQRLREINQDIKRGRPIKGFAEELSDIVGRIIPQVPRGVQKKEQPPTKQNQEEQNQTKNPKEPRKSLYQQ